MIFFNVLKKKLAVYIFKGVNTQTGEEFAIKIVKNLNFEEHIN